MTIKTHKRKKSSRMQGRGRGSHGWGERKKHKKTSISDGMRRAYIDVPPEVYDWLADVAISERRSISQQASIIMERAYEARQPS